MTRVSVDVTFDAETIEAVEEARDRIEEETGLDLTVEHAAGLLIEAAAEELPEDPEKALAELLDDVRGEGGEAGE